MVHKITEKVNLEPLLCEDPQIIGALGGFAAGKLRSSLGGSAPVDVINVKVGEKGLEDSKIEVGKYITSDLFVKYARQIQAPEYENANEIQVQYRFFQRWYIDTYYGDAGNAGIELIYKYRY